MSSSMCVFSQIFTSFMTVFLFIEILFFLSSDEKDNLRDFKICIQILNSLDYSVIQQEYFGKEKEKKKEKEK